LLVEVAAVEELIMAAVVVLVVIELLQDFLLH
jgi:hypothetical protein